MTNINLIKPSGWAGLSFQILIGVIIGTVFLPIVIFPILFLFGDFQLAKKYTIIVSFLFSLIIMTYETIKESKKDNANYRRDLYNKNKITKSNFASSKCFNSNGIYFAINLNEDEIIYQNTNESKIIYLTPEDILDISIEIDEETVSKVSSGVAGSIITAGVGGVLFGGIGAIVGAVAGKNTKTNTYPVIRSIKIKIVINKGHSNLITLSFFDGLKNVDKNDKSLIKPMREANEWWKKLKSFIDT